MTKYKVSKAVMDELNEYKDNDEVTTLTDLLYEISYESIQLRYWIFKANKYARQREQAVIDYVFNGADNFEVKTPTWVIVVKQANSYGDWMYINVNGDAPFEMFAATRQDAINSAERITNPMILKYVLYGNSDFEAIEVEE